MAKDDEPEGGYGNSPQDRALKRRVRRELKAHDGKNMLESYALYMLRVQMYELSLKQDLMHRFGVGEDAADRMNLSSIFRHFVKQDIRAHPSLYANIQEVARQRNEMAHGFLASASASAKLAGVKVLRLFERDLSRWVFELEVAWQQYLMLKQADQLYQDYGVKPEYPERDAT